MRAVCDRRLECVPGPRWGRRTGTGQGARTRCSRWSIQRSAHSRRLLREKKQKGVALGAARDVLDRNDLTGKTRIDLEHGGSIVHRVELVVIDGIDDDND